MTRHVWPKVILVLMVAVLLGTHGCGPPDLVGPTVPVSGKVTVDGKAVPTGNIVFKPDAAKGNTNLKYEPVAFINADGTYTVKTGTKNGAPVGWYKVAIEASEPITDVVATGTVPKAYVNTRYNSVENSGLSVEVKADPAPGAYDFPLKK
jgi:hypothetical protein